MLLFPHSKEQVLIMHFPFHQNNGFATLAINILINKCMKNNQLVGYTVTYSSSMNTINLGSLFVANA